MLAKLSIRAKITVVVSFLLIALSGMGALALRQMSTINGATVEIVESWLPGVRVLGEIRVSTITYRATLRNHLLAGDFDRRSRSIPCFGFLKIAAPHQDGP